MPYFLFSLTSLIGSIATLRPALAHFGLGDDEDVGHAIFWIYGIVIASVIGLIIYRKFVVGNQSPEYRALKRKLNELERALKSCRIELKNAEDYPNHCGLSFEQRQERMASASSIEQSITITKAKLATC